MFGLLVTSCSSSEVPDRQVEAGRPVYTPTGPEAMQVTPLPDRPSLLEEHCARCHDVQWLEKADKPRTGWEQTLTQMESLGVQLSDTEREALLDYLAVDEP